MRNSILIIVIIASIISQISCTVSTENLSEPNKLRLAIAESIAIPFQEKDTVIYQSTIGICGNSSKDEINRHYVPQLDQAPYSDILEANYNGKVLFTGEELNKTMDSICQYQKKEYETIWDCFSKNKIDFSLSGIVITNNSVEIYERYDQHQKVHFIQKVFKYKNGSWTYRVTLNERIEHEGTNVRQAVVF